MAALKYFIIISTVIFFNIGCKDSNEPKKVAVDPFESALPHGESPEHPLKLSNADLDKLANAKGKTVEPITSKLLFKKINNARDTLNLFYFWSINDLVSTNMLSNLSKVKDEFNSNKLKIHLINFDEQISEKDLNKSVRLFSHFDGYYRVNKLQRTDMLRIIYNEWDGKVPGLLVVNKTNATKSFFSNEFTSDELYAILQPLAL